MGTRSRKERSRGTGGRWRIRTESTCGVMGKQESGLRLSFQGWGPLLIPPRGSLPPLKGF